MRPVITASAVVKTYMPSVFTPMLPRRLGSASAATPEAMVRKTSGMTSMRINRTKSSPIHAIEVASSPQTSPRIAPRTSAARMRFHSATPNHQPQARRSTPGDASVGRGAGCEVSVICSILCGPLPSWSCRATSCHILSQVPTVPAPVDRRERWVGVLIRPLCPRFAPPPISPCLRRWRRRVRPNPPHRSSQAPHVPCWRSRPARSAG